MEYSFFYDETEHSRKINIQTVTADNYYDNFSTAIIGWKKENEDIIIKQYEAFEEKYTYRKKNGELKSQTMKQKDLKYGFATLNNHTIGFYEDLLATVYKGNIIKNLIMDCQSYTKYRPNETTGGIFVSWRRKEELPTGA